MKHRHILIEISSPTSKVRDVVKDTFQKSIDYLLDLGYLSLEYEFSAILANFLDFPVTQFEIPTENHLHARRSLRRPTVWTTYLKRNNTHFFLDVDIAYLNWQDQDVSSEKASPKICIEIDVFAANIDELSQSSDQICSDLVSCFNLEEDIANIIHPYEHPIPYLKILSNSLTEKEPISTDLYTVLSDKKDREILVEIKKRGSLLASDLPEISNDAAHTDELLSSLDIFAEKSVGLLIKKIAIVCTKTEEIIFLLNSVDDIKKAENLECPKCSTSIGNEKTMAYYKVTDHLRNLIDGNRWMSLHIGQSLVNAGVSETNIVTEVKHGEDEIDVLAFHMGNMLVIEAKERPMSLNDAYKLSAKTARLDTVIERIVKSDDLSELLGYEPPILSPRISDRIRKIEILPTIITVAVSSQDISQDAKDLLEYTRPNTKFLEYCDSSIEEFCRDLIGTIEKTYQDNRLEDLTSFQKPDSLPNLFRSIVWYSLSEWHKST